MLHILSGDRLYLGFRVDRCYKGSACSDSSTIRLPIIEATCGKNWVSTFSSRREEIKARYAQQYNYSQAQYEDPKIIKGWFDCLQQIQMQYGISHEDFYNFDETGFAMGLIAPLRY
jgi:hypothetical protein